MEWFEQDNSKLIELWRNRGMERDTVPRAFESRNGCRALVSREPFPDGTTRWHVSVSREDRVPQWAEMSDAAHELRPGVPFVMGVPPKSWWINVHEHCLHMWETLDEGLVESWRQQARGDTPS